MSPQERKQSQDKDLMRTLKRKKLFLAQIRREYKQIREKNKT